MKNEKNYTNISMEELEKQYQNFYETQELIWGLSSADSPCSDAELGALNDIEIIVNRNGEHNGKSCETYSMYVETAYIFDKPEYEIDYYTKLYKAVKNWCQEEGIIPTKLEECNFNGVWSFTSLELEQLVSQFITVCLGHIDDMVYGKLK